MYVDIVISNIFNLNKHFFFSYFLSFLHQVSLCLVMDCLTLLLIHDGLLMVMHFLGMCLLHDSRIMFFRSSNPCAASPWMMRCLRISSSQSARIASKFALLKLYCIVYGCWFFIYLK